MASLNVTPAGKYDLGKTPCEGETLRRTLKHLFFRLGFTMGDDRTWGSGRFGARNENLWMRAHLVKDLDKILRFCWAERWRAIWRLFGPQRGGNNEGDKPRFDPQLCEILGSNRREVWGKALLVSGPWSRWWRL